MAECEYIHVDFYGRPLSPIKVSSIVDFDYFITRREVVLCCFGRVRVIVSGSGSLSDFEALQARWLDL